MTNNRYHFHSSVSPVKPNNPNQGNAELQLDWHREAQQAEQPRMFIGEQPLSNFRATYNNFSSIENVEAFFQDIILTKVHCSQNEKTQMINYLKLAFHQGGLMYPVSNAFATGLTEMDENNVNRTYAAPVSTSITTKIFIHPTETGFRIQEIAKIGKLSIPPEGSSVVAMADELGVIEPDEGYDYIVELEATLNIDFTDNSDQPNILIESNHISYGHQGIKDKIDPRNFLEKLIDFIKYYLSFNQVEPIKPRPEM